MKSLRPLTLALLVCTLGPASTALACCDTAAKSAASTTPATSATVAAANKTAKTGTPTVPADGGCSAQVMSIKTAANGSATGSASGSMTGCSAAMSAQCTPAMRAACEKNPAVAAAMGCSMKSTGTSATTASTASGASSKDACGTHGASVAKGAACPMHGNSATAAGMDHCAGAKGASLTMAAAGMICAEHMGGVAHDCSACEAWADADQAVRALGAKMQVVSLKNGAMIVYTADTNAGVKAIQTLIAKRSDKMTTALSASTDKKLCDECKALRGAMASGKLHREVVNVERGCLTLITSDDRAIVQKIRAMTGQPVAMR